MKPISLFSLFLLLATLTACQEDEPQAPPITTENTFSCKINGELFIPEGKNKFLTSMPAITIDIIGENNWLFILASEERDIYIYI